MNIFITGHRGFIGRHLIKFLKNNGFTILTSTLDLSQGIPIFSRLDCIIHLAWKVPQKRETEDISSINRKNLAITKNVLELASTHSADLIFSSSSAVYGLKKSIVEEISCTNPSNSYGENKLEAEQLILKHCQQYALNTILLRIFNAYGPEQSDHFLIPYLISTSLDGDTIVLKTPNAKRDFIHIKDICTAFNKAILFLAKKREIRTIFNLGSGTSFSIKEVTADIKKLAKSKSEISIQLASMESTELKANISKIEKYLSWRPEIELKQGLNETIASYQKTI